MTGARGGLGGRLRLITPAEHSPAQADLYAEMTSKYVPWAQRNGFQADGADGTVIGPFNAMLLNPGVGVAFLALQAAESQQTSLRATVREVVILSVGAVWQAPYELYAHTAVANTAGLAEADVDALAAGRPPQTLAPDELLAHRFTRELVSTHRVNDELYARTVEIYGEAGVFDIVLLAGLYCGVCGLLNAFDVPRP